MDSTKKYDNPSPETKANVFSKLVFGWILPFFKYGYSNDLEEKDLYNTTKKDLSEELGDELEKNWEIEQKNAKQSKKQPKLINAIYKTFAKSYSVYGIILFLQAVVLRLTQPLVLAEYINYFDRVSKYSYAEGWAWAMGVILMALLNVFIMHQAGLGTQRVGMRCRVACCSLIYRKVLKLNKSSLEQTAAGQVVNLLSNDVQRFDFASMFLHYIWIMPIQACIAAFIMYNSVGVAALAGLLAITLQAVPLQGYLSSLQGKLRYKIAKKTDNRVKLMSEITSGIQVIKLYAWEKPFEKMVELARKAEIDIITQTSYIRGFSTALMVFTERATLFLTVVTYVLMGYKLTSDKVFSMAQFFNTIQLYMAIFFPLALFMYAEAKISVGRIEEFLSLEEKKEQSAIQEVGKTGQIRLVNVKAGWNKNVIVDTLNNIDLNIVPGTLTCVVGTVGSGKSSLLQLLLKEMPIHSGKVTLSGTISYASQEPWLFVSNVRNNILFGQEFSKSRYKNIIKVCALERDMDQFPHRDKTIVGERGVSLSGGQRARINLARAIYRDADIYLLDDPLSAVDTHVGKHLFDECIKKYLNGKTRILVTHQLQFLREADQIVILNNGHVERIGTFAELSENELSHLKQEDNDEVAEALSNGIPKKRLMSLTSETSTNADDEEADEVPETQELMEKGALSSANYIEYFRSGSGICFLLFLVVTLIIAQVSCNAGDLWLTFWTNEEETRQYNEAVSTLNEEDNNFDNNSIEMRFGIPNLISSNDSSIIFPTENYDILTNSTNAFAYSIESQYFYIYIYSVLIVLSILLTTLRSMIFVKICMTASRNLHNNMFKNILLATMRFFDTNPSGRILNRFSKDIGAVDELLPRAMLEAIQIFLVMWGILIMVFIVSPIMIVPAIILAGLFFLIRKIYLATAQDVKRLEGLTKAPVFSHVSASISGLSTIRSCKAELIISKEFDALQDKHTSSWFLFIASSEAFGFYLDIVSVLFLVILTFRFLLYDDGKTFSGDVGLVISQSLILTGMLQYGMRQTAEVASQMTSVERVLQYTKLDKEGPFESTPTKRPHRDWPHSGKISFKNVNLRYISNEPPVLKNLNIDVAPGEKIGIVGRTGAGKSSLISAIFRLAPFDGIVSIDEIDSKSIGLIDLRSHISIIPQEPVLFSASVRYNLDPLQKSNDNLMWKALEDVGLKDAVDNLDQYVSEGGTNFSVGQRQLMCLARAILRNNKVLVMDEATANVDPHTDSLIQTTIRKNFESCTVLTIAHRLNTIIDSNKVLVMNFGEAVEFGHPHELLQNTDGFFSRMLHETGKTMEENLRQLAKEAFDIEMNATIDEETISVEVPLERNDSEEETVTK